MSTFAFNKVAEKFPGAVLERYADRGGDEWLVTSRESLTDVMSLLKNDPELDFKIFTSIDCVDRLLLAENDPRFELVYFAYSVTRKEHVRVKVRVSEDDATVPSLTAIYQGANWWERFCWDFYGIQFLGHPNPRRILMYEEFKGHPLRKDYGLRDRQPLIPERPLKDLFRGPGTSGPAA